MTVSSKSSYKEYKAKVDYVNDCKSAAQRCWATALWGFVGPIGSVVCAVKSNNWIPTAVATGVFVACSPLAVVDMGLTMTTLPGLTSAGMFILKTNSSRKKLRVIMPQQADELLYDSI